MNLPASTVPGSPVRDAAQLSPAGFEALAIPLLDSLYNFAHWLTRNPDEAEDLVQETCLKALRGYRSFAPGTHFRAWIFQILRNTFLGSRTRAEWRLTDALDPEIDLPAPNGSPEQWVLGSFDVDAVCRAIEELPVHLREVIVLCDVEDASYREIAGILSIPMGTVMSRLARARQRVRETLRGTGSAADHRLTRRISHDRACCL